jgi:GT2 family glycosyltransferase
MRRRSRRPIAPCEVTARSDIGIVIATRNRRAQLLETLARLGALAERPPVCVVDNGSTDGTGEAIESGHPDVNVIQLERNAGAAARNVGAAALTTALIAFNDDDSWWAPGALTRAAQTFGAYPRLGLLAACVLVGEQSRIDPVSFAMAGSPIPVMADLPGPPVLGFLACGAVVRRSAFLDAGGFNEKYGVGGEEHLLALDLAAAGWGLAFVPSVRTHHHPAPGRRAGRRHCELRNDLWSAWLRRPLGPAIRHTLRVTRDGWASGGSWVALGSALRGLPWVLRGRRVVPPEVEAAVALLHAHRR